MPTAWGGLTETDYPDAGKTTITYNDTQYSPGGSTPSVEACKLLGSTSNCVTSSMDGLGHVLHTNENNTIFTDTTYTGLDQVLTATNPYQSTSDSSYGITTYAYDALGRVTGVSHPDGTTLNYTYTGRATEITDEGKQTACRLRNLKSRSRARKSG